MIDQQSHNKNEIRKRMIALRNELSKEEISQKSSVIFGAVENLPQFISAKNMMIYWSIKNEVDTTTFIDKWFSDKQTYLPVIEGDNIHACRYLGKEHVKPTGKFQIPEPSDTTPFPPENLDLVIVPGVTFDRNNNRMGYGKGFYDRFLKQTKAFKIGVCFSFQLVNTLVIDEWDVPMDLVISD